MAADKPNEVKSSDNGNSWEIIAPIASVATRAEAGSEGKRTKGGSQVLEEGRHSGTGGGARTGTCATRAAEAALVEGMT